MARIRHAFRRPARVLVVALVLATAPAWCGGHDGLDDLTRRELAEALACVNLSVEDMGWDKRPISDAYRLSVVNETLDRPLALAHRAEQAERDFGADPSAAVLAGALWLDLPVPVTPVGEERPSVATGAPKSARAMLQLLLRARRAARHHRERATQLDWNEQQELRMSGARLYTDESEEDWDMAPVLALARRVDVAALTIAASELARCAERVRELATEADGSAWRTRAWSVDGVSVAIGGPGRDVHEAEIVIDAGGDDLYQGCRFVVDLGGDDTYRDVASGYMGVGLVVDMAGNDRYLGGDFVQGGAAFGASLLVDVEGDDRYEAGQCSQGAAFFGIGMLFDLAGNDAYRGARFVQGFGGVRGLGVLSDVAGNDTYYAGGKYSHAPLLPENYQSLSQGFGFGLRGASVSGGVGILADHGGNDVYSAEVYGQGASYWFALGILVDSAGHDKYDLFQYGQGAGIHLSAGVLLDRAGHDAYSCSNGVAQGCGHDWATGLLWDLAGNDYYQGSGMTQGSSNANAVGILIDRAGNDAYSGWNEKIQGDSFPSRGTIGLGVLLDLGGTDRYTHGGKDGGLWTRGAVGVGLDAEEETKP